MSPSYPPDQAVLPAPATLDGTAAALSYAEMGWRVFPVHTVDSAGRCSCGHANCQDPGKHPRTDHGFKDASTDEAQINAWWSIWPDANVGIATGAVSGIVVIDIDAPDVPEDLCRLLGTEADRIPTVQTGGGGLHLYFRHPGTPVTSRARILGLPVDVRADGGYVIAPPSMHTSGNEYKWIREGDPDEMPVALSQALQRSTSVDASSSSVPSTASPIYEGSRNHALTSLGGSMRRPGFGLEAITAALLAENDVRCSPPLNAAEVQRIARSIANYPAGEEPGLGSSAGRKHLRGYSVAEVRKMAPEHHDWKFGGYVAGGLLTILASKPKVGKTTFVCAAIAAMAQEAAFLARPTSSCPVVYLTEENPTTFWEVLSRTGVTDHGFVTIVPRAEAFGLSWEDIIEDVRRLIEPLGKVLLVVDTLADWVSQSSDWENSSSAVKEVMRPLRQIASEGHAVLGLLHSRKSGGGIQDSIRGSSAFAGDADIIVGLDERKGFDNGRIIIALGRLTATPRKLQVEFDGNGFQLAGETVTSIRDQAERDILAMLPGTEDEAMLLKVIKGRVSCSSTTVDRVLEDLVAAGIVNRKKAKTPSNRISDAYWRS